MLQAARPVRNRPGTGLAAGAALAVVLVATVVVAVGIGSVHVPAGDVVDVVLRRLGVPVDGVTLIDDRIVWQLRMPRVVGAAATGAGLALAGAVLQSLTRNDLADPYLLGISGGASVGAVAVIVLGVGVGSLGGSAALGAAAFVTALVALLLVLALATGRSGDLPPARTVLAGVAVGQMCAAFTSFAVMMSGDHDAARRVLAWTMGSLAGVRWLGAGVLVVVALVALVGIVAHAADLDAFAFGDSSAASLGVSIRRTRWVLLVGTALLTACLVAYTGAIGFVGLVVPHVVRLVCGPLHRRLLPLSALAGAVLMIWADTLARSLIDGQEIPIGVVTAVLGAPLFAYLLRRESRAR
ncbi:iron chelate uptake ABC transporter family permease subunit [Pimelobacter simplex]|uniref:ABC transporter (Iron.B12.siderophore.hemin), permease component n=1 Tax=Nocardioides simplex TaxID=2045 RepID=A0A0A1DUI2_NOCSI|nr:iron chelate uptake ABC transporter family permease subunit [Pimelobacter simplex]AIY20227.2 ABC transporter (iron.B12.siderophore.hemin), permease component [Pimelobacter simplex]MCG8150779.1 iron chelate uptake ABC transporter family permease subunit [Pimelobacter simplex]GEB15299.1 ABC transporter permease [Pimelobacter simplex]SFM83914.1 iron complex transport system permease protein [Pimelobacter simplex]